MQETVQNCRYLVLEVCEYVCVKRVVLWVGSESSVPVMFVGLVVLVALKVSPSFACDRPLLLPLFLLGIRVGFCGSLLSAMGAAAAQFIWVLFESASAVLF